MILSILIVVRCMLWGANFLAASIPNGHISDKGLLA